jgi:hypothetical protein
MDGQGQAQTDTDGQEDRSGQDIDIWGDGSPTRSTPIPAEWDIRIHTEEHGFQRKG